MDKYYNPFKVKTVKDEDGYSLGVYVDRIPVFGLYIDGEETFIKDLEVKSKGKFKLEKDPENYAQEVRMYYFILLDKYLSKFGEPSNEKEELDMIKYVSKGCVNKLKDLSRSMKNKVSYYDKEIEEVVIQCIISIESCKSNEVYWETLEYELYSKENGCQEFSNEFSKWFNKNKETILTKKQLDYINGDVHIPVGNRKNIERNIVKRIDKKYSDLTIEDCKNIEKNRKIDILENILDSDSDEELLKKIVNVIDSEAWLMEILYSMDMETCKLITDATKGNFYKSSKIYQICSKLIEKIEKLNNK